MHTIIAFQGKGRERWIWQMGDDSMRRGKSPLPFEAINCQLLGGAEL
jgi:hypothetical protein